MSAPKEQDLAGPPNDSVDPRRVSAASMSPTLRYMRSPDIRPVAAIDALSFQPPWPEDSYAFEIHESRASHMVVLELAAGMETHRQDLNGGWRAQLSGLLHGGARNGGERALIAGYGGLWKVEDEAHISTLATHPRWRGNGYGEILLAGMIAKALRLKAAYIVLEVRVSNTVAQRLYKKYGFSRHGRKRNYYGNNREDAWDMRLSLDWAARRRFHRLYDGLKERHAFRDNYSWKSRPWR